MEKIKQAQILAEKFRRNTYIYIFLAMILFAIQLLGHYYEANDYTMVCFPFLFSGCGIMFAFTVNQYRNRLDKLLNKDNE